jgi:hypothetical protein
MLAAMVRLPEGADRADFEPRSERSEREAEARGEDFVVPLRRDVRGLVHDRVIHARGGRVRRGRIGEVLERVDENRRRLRAVRGELGFGM